MRCNSARGMIASVIGTDSYTSILVCSPFYSNSTTGIYWHMSARARRSLKKIRKLVLFVPVPLSPFFLLPSLLSPFFSILFYLPDSSILFLLATLEHVLLSYSSRFQIFVFTIHQRRSSTRGGD